MRKFFIRAFCYAAILTAALIIPYAAPSVRAEEATVLRGINTNEKVVYLTFDDGPDSNNTKSIMETLLSYDAQGTFFFTGVNMTAFPNVVKEVYDNGFNIGLHGYAHSSLAKMSAKGVEKDLGSTNDVLYGITGERSKIVRPPYGAFNSGTSNVLSSLGFKAYLWTIDPSDWSSSATDESSIQNIKSNLRPGAIILLHSGSNQGRAARILPEVIEYIKSEGYSMKALPDPGYVTAPISKSSTVININGKESGLGAYLINGNDYVNLRDFAIILRPTQHCYSIEWDEASKAVNIITGVPYPAEMDINKKDITMPGRAARSAAPILIDGVETELSAYTVDGGGLYNLRELSESLGAAYTYDSEANAINFEIPILPANAFPDFITGISNRLLNLMSGTFAFINYLKG